MNRRASNHLLAGLLWSSAILTLNLLTGYAHLPSQEFAIVQMCDPQIGFGDYGADLAHFRQAAKQINALKPDLVVICGDLVNGAGKKSFADFNGVKAEISVPCYCAPGNHDVGNVPTSRLLQQYRNEVGEDYFSFEHKGCAFIIVNSQLWKAPLPGESEKQDAWLKKTLATEFGKHHPIFIVCHYPLFVNEPRETETYYDLPLPKRGELLELFSRSGVVAVLAGHTHKTLVRNFQGIQMVTSETTCKNFDGQPFGFRLWHLGGDRPYQHEFVPLDTNIPN